MRIDLLNAGTLREYASQPERLIATVAANPDRKHIVINEIQKLWAHGVLHGRQGNRSEVRHSPRALHVIDRLHLDMSSIAYL